MKIVRSVKVFEQAYEYHYYLGFPHYSWGAAEFVHCKAVSGFQHEQSVCDLFPGICI